MPATTTDLAAAQRTLDDLLGERYRVEIIDEAFVVTPSADLSHNLLVAELTVWLASRAPRPLRVATEQDVSQDRSGRSREPYWRPDIIVLAELPARGWPTAAEVVMAVEVVSPSNVADAGSAEKYLRERAEHGAQHGLLWLLGVDGDGVTWWHGGQPVGAGPEWATGLRIDGGRIRP